MTQERKRGREMTLYDLPVDVAIAIKQSVVECNLKHPERKIRQADVVTHAVRAWLTNGGGGCPHNGRTTYTNESTT